jgi:tripeptidyl-peptidase I
MGFLNPWLYAGGYEAFVDVVSGSSAGCNTSGFPAEVGWDAVTGYGTPYFGTILQNLGVGESEGGWKDRRH